MEHNLFEQDRTKKYQGQAHIHLLLRGAYEYFSYKKVYSEENFLVYRNSKDSSLIFDSELLTRLDSGEFLKILLTYRLNKNWVPQEVLVDKQVGKKTSKEIFSMDFKKNILSYQFTNSDGYIKEVRLQVPPKYQIATYNTVTSFLFISSKKYDPTGKNFHNILVANNLLTYVLPPQMNYIVLERISNTPQNVRINDKNLKATIYKAYSQNSFEKKNEGPLEIFISKHYSIPYMIECNKNIKIQIKFLHEADNVSSTEYV
ncbi:MAG: hypothetical protein HQK53_02070 [Oligoflexia bacterium]|nr:hypothetical protein [Oligoflexia bacterium]